MGATMQKLGLSKPTRLDNRLVVMNIETIIKSLNDYGISK